MHSCAAVKNLEDEDVVCSPAILPVTENNTSECEEVIATDGTNNEKATNIDQ